MTYAKLTYEAVKATDAMQLPAMAQRVLPTLRTLHEDHYSFGEELSEALMAAGDRDELQLRLDSILDTSADHSVVQKARQDRLEKLWRLHKQLKHVAKTPI